MQERVIENWLIKANEKAFQTPFCYTLLNKGYKVLHSTRHCGVEFGKDIIAIGPDGIICAYQLKGVGGGKLTLAKWREEVQAQMYELVFQNLSHPSLQNYDNSKWHKSFLVINGDLEEEVVFAIKEFNDGRDKEGQPEKKINVIVKGELLSDFIKLSSDLLVNLETDKLFLETFLDDGQGQLPKNNLSIILESILFPDDNEKEKSKISHSRKLLGAAVNVSIVIGNFTKNNNFFAEFEAWVIYTSYLLAYTIEHNLESKYWVNEFEIAQSIIKNSLINLYEETKNSKHLLSGVLYEDQPLLKIRTNILLCVMSLLAIDKMINKSDNGTDLDFLKSFCISHANEIDPIGEYVYPQLIIFYFYYRNIESHKPDELLIGIFSLITQINKPRGKTNFPNPYYEPDKLIPHRLGIADKPLKDTFRGHSYYAESLLHLIVRSNLKQWLKYNWADYTRLYVEKFVPDKDYSFFFYRCTEGSNYSYEVIPRQRWSDLKEIAWESEGKEIPEVLKKFPMFYLYFLVVYPHRINSSGIRWIDTIIRKQA